MESFSSSDLITTPISKSARIFYRQGIDKKPPGPPLIGLAPNSARCEECLRPISESGGLVLIYAGDSLIPGDYCTRCMEGANRVDIFYLLLRHGIPPTPNYSIVFREKIIEF